MAERFIVLIDDDELIHMMWKMGCDERGWKFSGFKSIDEFLNSPLLSTYDPNDVHIYVDSTLKNGVRGEIEAQKIHLQGFKNIYLATGYAADRFQLSEYPWISKVVGKDFPG